MSRATGVLLFILILLSGCGRKQLQPDQVRITGTMTPVAEGHITYNAGPVLDSARIGRDGTFSMVFSLDEPSRATLFFRKTLTDVYIEPGKELKILINPVTFPDNILFQGELGPVNDYLVLARKLDQRTSAKTNELFSLEPDRFITVSDSISRQKLQLLDEYASRYPEIDPGFVERTRYDIRITLANLHLQYPMRYSLIYGRYPDIRDDYHFDYMREFDLDNGKNLGSAGYKEFMEVYLDYRTEVYLAENPKTIDLFFSESVARFRVIQQQFTDQQVRDWFLYQAMIDHFSNFGTTHSETFTTNFRINCKNPDYLEEIELMLSKLEKIAMGKQAPDFTAFTLDGRKVRLSDYFGQLLYIGFWSSWSEWSLREIPYFEKLRKEYEGKPVTFILVSLDFEKDKNLWSATVNHNRLGGVQLIQDPKSLVLQKEYYLDDFPRYFLISRDGTIISTFAPKPVENVRETLNRLLDPAKPR